jgi:hypothetical protein
MCKRLLILATVMFMAAPTFAAIGIFDFSEDIGNPGGTGGTRYVATDEYLILAGGGDIWGNSDQFHYAYNEVSGNVRMELAPAWDIGGTNDWAKIEVMLRESASADSVHYSSAARRGGNHDPYYKTVDTFAGAQWRAATAGGSSNVDWWDRVPQKLAAQRIVSNDYQIVQALADFGSGWENINTQFWPSLPDDLLLGAAVTSHDNNFLAQARIGEVAYTQNPDLVGYPMAGDPLPEACGDVPGFLVSVAKLPDPWKFWDDKVGDNGDGRADKFSQAEYLVRNGTLDGFVDGTGYEVSGGVDAVEAGTAYRELVNLSDWGGVRAFTAPDHPDFCFPGVDNWTDPADDPDDDNQFGVVVEACVELTEGVHIFGGAFDDGVLIRVGGVEIGRTTGWNDTSFWIFEVPATGIYSLESIGFEEGGGAFMELYEYLAPDGSTMVLLGDVAAGASPVYVPEPATIALLGFGGLSMLRLRRKR